MAHTSKLARGTRECQAYLYSGTLCRRPAVVDVPMDFTTDTRPVCARHARAAGAIDHAPCGGSTWSMPDPVCAVCGGRYSAHARPGGAE
jgi:hypothetical protein